ncbi:MAG: thioredoxin family protein [Chitinispirillaceae bacterium]|nr:thioredoxin family protein [Chitinispirillaceae bacterium]
MNKRNPALFFLCLLAGLGAKDVHSSDLAVRVHTDRPAYMSGDTAIVMLKVDIPEKHHLYGNPLGPGIGKPLQLGIRDAGPLRLLRIYKSPPRKYKPLAGDWVWAYEKNAWFFLACVLPHEAPDSLTGIIELDALICHTACMPVFKEIPFLLKIDTNARFAPFASLPKGKDLFGDAEIMPGKDAGTGEGEGLLTEGEELDWREAADHFTVAGKLSGYAGEEGFLAFLADPAAASGATNAFAGKSIWLVILLVFIGGVALNLTPCVMPMIPITIAIIGAGAQASSRVKGFLIGGIYGFGMCIAYGLLGVAVVLTGSQFGAINASPVFNLMVAVLFAVLSLAMFDIIHIDFTRFRGRMRPGERGPARVVVVFLMGVLVAVLAGACVAPVLISVILYATSLYSEGRPAALLLPFLLGAGMAAPWPVAGAGLSFLPKPGKWMVWVRNGFGVIILAIALYYAVTGVRLIVQSHRVASEAIAVEPSSDLQWHHSLAEGLVSAKEKGQPVFIDFWATWCKNCHAMEATTFQKPHVQEAFKNYTLIKFQAERPDEPRTKEILKHFGVIGLPTYVVLEPAGKQAAPDENAP